VLVGLVQIESGIRIWNRLSLRSGLPRDSQQRESAECREIRRVRRGGPAQRHRVIPVIFEQHFLQLAHYTGGMPPASTMRGDKGAPGQSLRSEHLFVYARIICMVTAQRIQARSIASLCVDNRVKWR